MKNVSAAIITHNVKILLTRARGEKLEGHWEFSGGKQEQNESIFECLEGEIMEELNIECRALKKVAESFYEYEGGAINLIAITAEIVKGEIEFNKGTEGLKIDQFSMAASDPNPLLTVRIADVHIQTQYWRSRSPKNYQPHSKRIK